MQPTTYVRDTIDLVAQIHTRFLELGARLHKIHAEHLWQSSYESYEEFLDAANISRGNASMLEKVYITYILDGGKTQQELEGIGYSNLYAAVPLIEKDGIDGAVFSAKTLTRAEIEENKKEARYGVHEHIAGDDRYATCTVCGKFFKVDA